MTHSLQQLLAASALIVACEKICSSGVLSDSDERNLRILIVRAGKAFVLDSVAERPVQVSEAV